MELLHIAGHNAVGINYYTVESGNKYSCGDSLNARVRQGGEFTLTLCYGKFAEYFTAYVNLLEEWGFTVERTVTYVKVTFPAPDSPDGLWAKMEDYTPEHDYFFVMSVIVLKLARYFTNSKKDLIPRILEIVKAGVECPITAIMLAYYDMYFFTSTTYNPAHNGGMDLIPADVKGHFNKYPRSMTLEQFKKVCTGTRLSALHSTAKQLDPDVKLIYEAHRDLKSFYGRHFYDSKGTLRSNVAMPKLTGMIQGLFTGVTGNMLDGKGRKIFTKQNPNDPKSPNYVYKSRFSTPYHPSGINIEYAIWFYVNFYKTYVPKFERAMKKKDYVKAAQILELTS